MAQAKIGIIGCGVIGQHHMRAAQASEHIDLVAVADLNEQAAQTAAETFGARKVYTSAEDLIADDEIQGVVLALWACHRTAVGLKVLNAGKHLLTEKPVARSVDELKQLIAAAEKGNLIGACASSRYVFKAHIDPVAEYIASGKLGELRHIRLREIRPAGKVKNPDASPPPWRLNFELNGGGTLVNKGIYAMDYLMALTGWSVEPETCLAQYWQCPTTLDNRAAEGSDAETHCITLIRCKNNVAISIEDAEFIAAEGEGSMEIIGSEGSMRVKMGANGDVKFEAILADREEGTHTEVVWEGQDNNSRVHSGPINDFAQAILTGSRVKTDFERSMLLQRICDAVYASAQQGKAVGV